MRSAYSLSLNSPYFYLDEYEKAHSMRTSTYSVLIANQIKMPKSDIKTVQEVALLHDIGKIKVPREILNKKNSLDEHEWLIVKKHPEYSEKIMKSCGYRDWECKLARWHHEKLDGSGYPDKLCRTEIPLQSQIITVADIYDSLTHKRIYRREVYQHEQAIKILKEMGKSLNFELVEALDTVIIDNSIVKSFNILATIC